MDPVEGRYCGGQSKMSTDLVWIREKNERRWIAQSNYGVDTGGGKEPW